MKQKTKIAIIAFGCGSYLSALVSSIMHGNVGFALFITALLLIQVIFFMQEFNRE